MRKEFQVQTAFYHNIKSVIWVASYGVYGTAYCSMLVYFSYLNYQAYVAHEFGVIINQPNSNRFEVLL